jgi:hypothetical protein
MKRASIARFSLLAVVCLGTVGPFLTSSIQADEKPQSEGEHSTSFSRRSATKFGRFSTCLEIRMASWEKRGHCRGKTASANMPAAESLLGSGRLHLHKFSTLVKASLGAGCCRRR